MAAFNPTWLSCRSGVAFFFFFQVSGIEILGRMGVPKDEGFLRRGFLRRTRVPKEEGVSKEDEEKGFLLLWTKCCRRRERKK